MKFKQYMKFNAHIENSNLSQIGRKKGLTCHNNNLHDHRQYPK